RCDGSQRLNLVMLRWELGTHLDFDLVTLVLAFRQEGHRHFCVLTATDEP
ncbi:hypothetical protein HMPREF9603_02220, partial [Cutibacterium acnes HL001PA1]